jgi:DNA-binding transcriptional MerR regulator
LARRAGIEPATLRAWERRYGILDPRRGSSGYRLYTADDERRLLEMARLVEAGVAPAQAAQRLAPGAGADAGRNDADPGFAAGLREELLGALLRYDEAGADRVFDRAVGSLTVETLLSDLVLPVLRELGRGWEEDDVSVGQEHFSSNVLRGRLLGIARGWGGGGGRLALLAAPAGEHHDLGLVAFGLTLRNRGWRIAFLGADTPLESLRGATAQMRPDAAVLTVLDPSRLTGCEPDLTELAGATRLLLGGAGVPEGLSERVGAERLPDDPVGAAIALAG